MSGADDNKPDGERDELSGPDVDPDIDAALEAWELEFEGEAQPESEPMPQSGGGADAAPAPSDDAPVPPPLDDEPTVARAEPPSQTGPSGDAPKPPRPRPLYRPPSPDEVVSRGRGPAPKRAPPPPPQGPGRGPRPPAPDPDGEEHDKPTTPPSAGNAPEVDLDLDGLLGDLDEGPSAPGEPEQQPTPRRAPHDDAEGGQPQSAGEPELEVDVEPSAPGDASSVPQPPPTPRDLGDAALAHSAPATARAQRDSGAHESRSTDSPPASFDPPAGDVAEGDSRWGEDVAESKVEDDFFNPFDQQSDGDLVSLGDDAFDPFADLLEWEVDASADGSEAQQPSAAQPSSQPSDTEAQGSPPASEPAGAEPAPPPTAAQPPPSPTGSDDDGEGLGDELVVSFDLSEPALDEELELTLEPEPAPVPKRPDAGPASVPAAEHKPWAATLDDPLETELELEAEPAAEPPAPPPPPSAAAKQRRDRATGDAGAPPAAPTPSPGPEELPPAAVARPPQPASTGAPLQRAPQPPPDAPAVEPGPRAPSHPAPEDKGAAVARRTVRYRKPRKESFPLIGRGGSALRHRRELLRTLADASSGSRRARLLTAAAEIGEQLGEPDAAQQDYRGAHEADPHDVVVLRALRREASQRADWGEVASLLHQEAQLPLSSEDEALALTALAEVQLSQLSDPAAAEKAARAALGVSPESVSASLLVAEACLAQNRHAQAHAALARAAESWADAECKAFLWSYLGRAAEQAGDVPTARNYFSQAAEAMPVALPALLGLARTARSAGDLDATVSALERAATRIGGDAAEAVRRLAARLLHLDGRSAQAAERLSKAGSLLSLQARAEAAAAAGDRTAQQQALQGWASAAGGTERALALVQLAEVHADAGELDEADAALKDAALADSKLGTVRVVREVLARRAGDPSRLAHAIETTSEGALAAAAKMARDAGALPRERELLARALDEGESPVAADVLGLDATANAQDAGATDTSLRRQAERTTPEHRIGPLVTLAHFARSNGRPEAAETLLAEARELSPADALILRQLAWLQSRDRPKEAAALWLEEAAHAPTQRAAFAATRAGWHLAEAGEDPTSALRRALDSQPDYLPAAWSLEPIVRRSGDREALAHLHENLAEHSADPVEVAGRWIRAALLYAARADHVRAKTLLGRAREHHPDDGVVRELVLRVGSADSPAERVTMLEQDADALPPELARAARLRAAIASEDGGDAARAAALYRQVLEQRPDDPFARLALDRVELRAGEHARVAERRFAAVRDAAEPSARVAALEELAELDMVERDDPASAVLSLQSILEVAPGHLPSLRRLERYLMDNQRDEDLAWVEQRLVAHLQDTEDVVAHGRLAVRLLLAGTDAEGNAADTLLLQLAPHAPTDLWLARRVEGAARASGDRERLTEALVHLAQLLAGPTERASAMVRAAQGLEQMRGAGEAAEQLAPAVQGAPHHPVAAEELARLREASGDPAGAAEAYETAAQAAHARRHRAALWYRSGILWQQQGGDVERALAAFERAAESDITHLDLFERIRELLQHSGELIRLEAWTRKRLEAGGDAAKLANLHMTRATLCEQLGDREGTKEALRAALALEPERVEALRKLANICVDDEEWRSAAEALIRIARLRQEREELRWVFFMLGDIYDEHMPDAQRAEAAYRRVLKLVPNDLEAMERLGELYRKQGELPKAVQVLRQVLQRQKDPERNRDLRRRLSEVLEQQGQLREAERELEEARREARNDLGILRALADFYQRQNAQPALAMHLNRAVNDLRQALETDPADVAVWSTLVEVLGWRGRDDAARCCASAATAVGIVDVELAKRLDSEGGAPGGGKAAADPELDELLAPETLPNAARHVFRIAAEAFDKLIAFDARALRLEKAERSSPFQSEAQQVAQWFGIDELHVALTSVAPRLCIPIGRAPLTIAVGRDLVRGTTGRERLFLLARAAKVAMASLGPTVRAQPEELALAVAGLVRAYDSSYAPAGFDAKDLDEMAKRMNKAVARRAREELRPLAIELGGAPDFDPLRLGLAASELADRVGLLALGDAHAALSALLKLAGERAPEAEKVSSRIAMARRVPEAWSLLFFAVSDAHFEARHRTGADRR